MALIRVALACILALPLLAAPCTGNPADCAEVTFNLDGAERLYAYHVPQSSSCPSFNLPVVLHLHGGTGNANGGRGDTEYANGDKNCYVLVWPQAVIFPAGGVWNAGDCIGLPPSSGYTGPQTGDGCGYGLDRTSISDVRYIGAVLDDLKTRVSYDSRRVYLSGFSLGGSTVHRLACELSTRIAAAAVIEAAIKIPQCHPARPVPLQQWQSLGDTSSPFNGGPGDPSTQYTVSVHLANLGLPAFSQPTSSTVIPSARVPGVTDSVRIWSGNGLMVVLHTLSSQLEHTWLRNDPLPFDWQETNWKFFSQYTLPAERGKRHAVRH